VHEQGAFSVENIWKGLFCLNSALLLFVALQWRQLCTVPHLIVQCLDLAHHLVFVQQHAALLFFHSVTDPFPYRRHQPQILGLGLANFTPEKVVCYSDRQVLVQVVPLIYLVWSYQHLLVKYMETFRKRNSLLGEFLSHQIWGKNKFNLFAGMALHTNQVLHVITHFLNVLLIKAGLLLSRKEASKLSALALFPLYWCYHRKFATK